MKKFLVKAQSAIASKAGEGYMDTIVKILICIVVGVLLLFGLYALIKNVVMPKTQTEVDGLFTDAAQAETDGKALFSTGA